MGAKLQMFFKADEGQGWSEKWYWRGTFSISALTALMTQFVDARVSLLTKDCEVDRIRLQTAFKRDPLIFVYNAYSNRIGNINENTNDINNAVLVRSEAVNTGYNRNFMHGVPDSMVNGNVFTPSPAWQSAFASFQAFVRDSGNFSVDAAVDNPQTPIALISVGQGSPKGIKANVDPATPLPFPGKGRIKGASVLGYNGIKSVIKPPTVAAPTVWLLGGAKPQQDNPVADNVTYTPIIQLSNPMSQLFVEGFTNHKVGRFFGQLVGRAATKLSLRP